MIDKSVGIAGANLKADVAKIVRLLNRNRHLLIPNPDLPEGGEYSDAVGERISTFQRRVVTEVSSQDGRVDPGGRTLEKLEKNARDIPAENLLVPLFPFPVRPNASYSAQGRAFRANRTTTRLHAACDMLFPVSTPIRAMADGKVVRASYLFYSGTDALEVDHGTFIARYGEILPGSVPHGLDQVGATISRGEMIASVGRLNSGSSMLHLELYSGTESGPLTVGSNAPFQRRNDLLNPTDFLDIASLELVSRPGMPPQAVPVTDAGMGVKYVVTDDVDTWLRVRAEPNVSATPILSIGSTTLVTLRGIETGGSYQFKGQTRNDWALIEYLTMSGYVAAAYIAPDGEGGSGGASVIGAGTLNQILFEYEPTGASDRTARQDGLPQRGIHGLAASEAMAETDKGRVEQLKDKFLAAGTAENLPPALLAAIASRESRCGNVLSQKGYGDGGHGFGIMQVDDRSWSADTSEGPKGLAHIRQAAGILALKLNSTQHVQGLDAVLSLVTAASRYNGGNGLPAPNSDLGTTGGDYGNDVWARARYYARKIDWA